MDLARLAIQDRQDRQEKRVYSGHDPDSASGISPKIVRAKDHKNEDLVFLRAVSAFLCMTVASPGSWW